MFEQDRLTARLQAAPVTEWIQRLAIALIAALSLCSPPLSLADEPGSFTIRDAHAWNEGGTYLLDAQFAIHLSSGASEALENGIPLNFELQVQLVRTHTWWWDVVDVEIKQSRQLEFHDLSRSYLVKDLDAGTQGNYRRLEDALKAAGTVQNLVVTDQQLKNGRGYNIRLRGSLDIEALPTPVRLLAYVSSAWDMESEWYAWPLTR